MTTHFGAGAARRAVTSVEIGQSDRTAGHKYTHAILFELVADQEPVFRTALAAFEQDLAGPTTSSSLSKWPNKPTLQLGLPKASGICLFCKLGAKKRSHICFSRNLGHIHR